MAQRILVVRLSSLGDIVLTSSFLRSCAEHFPEALVSFVVREDLVDVAAALPNVARVVAVRRDLSLQGLLALASQLALDGYDHVFDLHHSMRARILVRGMHGELRPGFSKQEVPRWALVHLHRDVYDRFGGARSLRERLLEPLRRMGLEPRLHATELRLPAEARERAAAALRAGGARPGETLLALAPGSRWPSKCWPAERYAALVERLASRPDLRFVLTGGESERSLAYIAALGAPKRCIDLCGRLDMIGTAAALERCSMLVGNDSGLLHVAEAVGRPVVAFFGPTAPQFGYLPYLDESRVLRQPPPCSPCSKNGSRPCFRPTHECMENITVEVALEAVRDVLARVAKPQPV
jgi:lipopolysaccharide heptosyltransferase II